MLKKYGTPKFGTAIKETSANRQIGRLNPSATKVGSLLLLSTALLLLWGCQEERDSVSNSPQKGNLVQSQEHTNTAQILVTDFAGNKVILDSPAQRIIALAPHIVENLYTVGAGDQIVGVVTHSDYPAQASKHPIVGGYEQTNHERIVELNPDLIIAWESGNSQGSISKLKELGFKVLVDQPDSLSDIAKSLRLLGAVSGNNETADVAAQQFLDNVNKHKRDNESKRKVSTFYQVWNDPLISINGNHIISDAIRTCGGSNIFADEVAVAPRVSIESIIALNPESIIASGMGEERPEWLQDWKTWPSLNAVKNNNLFFVNPDHLQRHTVRQLLAIERICAQLDQARAKH